MGKEGEMVGVNGVWGRAGEGRGWEGGQNIQFFKKEEKQSTSYNVESLLFLYKKMHTVLMIEDELDMMDIMKIKPCKAKGKHTCKY